MKIDDFDYTKELSDEQIRAVADHINALPVDEVLEAFRKVTANKGGYVITANVIRLHRLVGKKILEALYFAQEQEHAERVKKDAEFIKRRLALTSD
jgi:hypothetical protein